ncbi:MAG: hypothetical protein IJO43_00340 [Bacilli bacterium]|nr:hypothetical protein [Bacilli bacterium]
MKESDSMEELLIEIEQLKLLLSSIDKIDKPIASSSSEQEKFELENKKQECLLQIGELGLQRKIKNGEITEEVIQASATLASKRMLLKKELKKKKIDITYLQNLLFLIKQMKKLVLNI